ncbi:ATP-binding protein [Streptosporangium sp. NPDC051022]|uniref:ATP-binding protein n=1 Tax=Streptosporangium sp. NPDC051022 TaxID=3155752 RepID=UPI0034162285
MIWRENQGRLGGRHRRGEPVTRVRPRRWDAVNRERARELDQAEPVWTVWYGVGTRCFHAVAGWPAPGPAPGPLVVQASTAEELNALMREAERSAPPPRSRSFPPPAASPSVPPADSVPPVDSVLPAGRLSPSSANRLPYAEANRSSSPAEERSPVPIVHVPPPPSAPGASPMPETPDNLRTACWDPPYDPAMIGDVRRAVGERLAAWALAHLADDVVLVVGELLANAVTYGEPPIRVSLWSGADELCVRVTDHGADQPRHLDLGVEAIHGRGLTIVDALADDSGVVPLSPGPGKTTWARWRLAPVASGGVGVARLGDHLASDNTT